MWGGTLWGVSISSSSSPVHPASPPPRSDRRHALGVLDSLVLVAAGPALTAEVLLLLDRLLLVVRLQVKLGRRRDGRSSR